MNCPKCDSNKVETQETYDDGQLTDQWYQCEVCDFHGDKYDFELGEEESK